MRTGRRDRCRQGGDYAHRHRDLVHLQTRGDLALAISRRLEDNIFGQNG